MAAVIGWALLFLGAGMNPQPPPQEQVEQANRQRKIKKGAQSGDPEGKTVGPDAVLKICN